MKKAYVSPEAIKVNFEANDIITNSGMLRTDEWSDWKDAMSITWTELIG